MQFHHLGYVSEDPRVLPPTQDWEAALPDQVDVLIVGAGPAGHIAAAQLARFPGVTTRLIESRAGRLELGHADGVAVRSVETFQAFGFARRLIDEAYRITHTAFWKPDPANPANIVRAARTPDDPNGISEFPHLCVNQSRIQDYFVEYMRNSPSRMEPDYGWEFLALRVHADGDYPVEVDVRRTVGPQAGTTSTLRARFVIGCDGAHSQVRRAIGRVLIGDTSNHAWGVIDALTETDFPDIRTKSVIQSQSGGSILLIPREGGYLDRIYVDLGQVPIDNNGAVRQTPIEETVARANEILHPYTLQLRDVAWYSVYEVGHRVTDKFDDVPAEFTGIRTPRVFITGDACHTHSAKAGQGMNMSMQDGWNIAWKLGYVLSGRAPESLLDTYSFERQPVAQQLISFDRTWSSLVAMRPEELRDPTEVEEFYVRTWEFPTGMAIQYPPSLITGGAQHQALAAGFPIGKRFTSARVTRVCDANPVELGHLHEADGRWRVYVFADSTDAAGAGPAHAAAPSAKVATFGTWLAESRQSPLVALARVAVDPHDWFDVKLVYPRPFDEVELTAVPAVFRPRVGPFQVVNNENVFARDDTAEPTRELFTGRASRQRARSSSCDPTNTSPTCCRLTRPTSSRRSSGPSSKEHPYEHHPAHSARRRALRLHGARRHRPRRVARVLRRRARPRCDGRRRERHLPALARGVHPSQPRAAEGPGGCRRRVRLSCALA